MPCKVAAYSLFPGSRAPARLSSGPQATQQMSEKPGFELPSHVKALSYCNKRLTAQDKGAQGVLCFGMKKKASRCVLVVVPHFFPPHSFLVTSLAEGHTLSAQGRSHLLKQLSPG